MKKRRLLYIVPLTAILLITGILLSWSLFWIAPSQNILEASSSTNQLGGGQPMASLANESSPTSQPPSSLGSDELPPINLNATIEAASALPTPIPGETLVYFVPTDNDASATVLYLTNTEPMTSTVALRGFNYDGAMVYAQNISVKPTSFLRLISDSVAAAPPPSWATPAPITTNFTDFVYFASLSLPKGMKVEGYVLFNPGTSTINPRQDQGAIPLRFSTDPATVFLPTIQNNSR